MGEIVSIGFGGGLKLGQLAIEATTAHPMSHCWGRTDHEMVIDSTVKHHGVRERELSLRDYRWYVEIDLRFLPTLTRQELYRLAKEQIGTKYDKKWFFAYPINRRWNDEDAWSCSEFWTALLVKVGVFRHIDQQRVTPGDLMAALGLYQRMKR